MSHSRQRPRPRPRSSAWRCQAPSYCSVWAVRHRGTEAPTDTRARGSADTYVLYVEGRAARLTPVYCRDSSVNCESVSREGERKRAESESGYDWEALWLSAGACAGSSEKEPSEDADAGADAWWFGEARGAFFGRQMKWAHAKLWSNWGKWAQLFSMSLLVRVCCKLVPNSCQIDDKILTQTFLSQIHFIWVGWVTNAFRLRDMAKHVSDEATSTTTFKPTSKRQQILVVLTWISNTVKTRYYNTWFYNTVGSRFNNSRFNNKSRFNNSRFNNKSRFNNIF